MQVKWTELIQLDESGVDRISEMAEIERRRLTSRVGVARFFSRKILVTDEPCFACVREAKDFSFPALAGLKSTSDRRARFLYHHLHKNLTFLSIFGSIKKILKLSAMSEIKGLSKILEDFTNKETQEFKAITMVVAKEDFFMEIFSKGQITGEIAGGTYVFEILDYSFEKSNGIRKGIYLRCNEKTGDQRLQKILPRMYQVYIDGQMKRGWIKYINKLN